MTDGIQLFIEYIGIYLFKFGAIKVTRKLSSAMPVRATYVRRILLASTALYHVRPWVVRSWSLKTVLADRAAFTLLSRRAYLYIYPFFFLLFFFFFIQYVFSTVIFWGDSDSPTKPCREMAHQLGAHWCTACSRHLTKETIPLNLQ